MGIWMWLGDHPKDPSKSIMVIDTEGKYIFSVFAKGCLISIDF